MVEAKHLVLGAVILALLAGAYVAISGSALTQSAQTTRWGGQSAASVTTQGGNITYANLSAIVLTTRWTAYLGNISGTYVLGTAGSPVYSWSYTLVTNNATVCVSENSSAAFTSILNATYMSVDRNWSMGSAVDNATNTLTLTNCTTTLASVTVTNGTSVRDQGNSTFQTCAVSTDNAQTNASIAFCTNVSTAGRAFNNAGSSANYEIMAPTVPTGTAETYYFYVELR